MPLFSCPCVAPLPSASVRCCARRVPAVPPSLCASLARLLATPCIFRGFVALYPLLYPSPWPCTFSLPPLRCVSRSFSLPARRSLLLGPVRQRKDGGMWAFVGWARSSCNILYPRWHHVRCGCFLCCTAYNIPVSALVSTCVRTLLTLRAIPWCACPRRWWLRCACWDGTVCCVPTL